MGGRIQMDSALWRRASAAAVLRAFELARKGILKPPILITMMETEENGRVVFQCSLPAMDGSIEAGLDCPARLDAPVFLPLRFLFEDGEMTHSAIFEVPPGSIQ